MKISWILILFVSLIILMHVAFAKSSQPTLVLRGVTVINTTNGVLQPAVDVLISGDRISSVGPQETIALPKGVQVVQATGKFLIPGLWDMHVHAHREGRHELFYPLFVANGVTGIREMGSHLASLLALRAAWNSEVLGPQVIWSTPMFDGVPPSWSHGLSIETPESARSLVRCMKTLGFDFLKIYDRIPRDAYFALADEAKKIGIPFAGHVPITVTPAEVSRAGQKSIEHLQLVLESCIPGGIEHAMVAVGGDNIGVSSPVWLANSLPNYDQVAAQKLFKEFAANGTWHVPTLAWNWGAYFVDDEEVVRDPRLIYVMPEIRKRWEGYRHSVKPEDLAAGKLLAKRWVQLAGELHRAGVGLLAGTDVSDDPYLCAGFSLHDELGLLVDAGLTPLEALQAATLNVAKFFSKTESLGTVASGKVADLVLLDANPLEDIRNTRRIHAVVLRGQLLNRAKLDQILEQVKKLVSE
jgi:imidazolonepropionase-like amidohydrolase